MIFSDLEQKYKIKAFQEYLLRSLVGFACLPDLTGAGTLVRVGEHVLVATARHVLKEIGKTAGSTVMLSYPLDEEPENWFETSDFIEGYQYDRRKSPQFDVGFIQLKQRVADKCRDNAVDLSVLVEEISIEQLQQQHQEIAGFPKALVEAKAKFVPSLLLWTSIRSECPYNHTASLEAGIPLDFGFHVDWSSHRDPDTGEPTQNPHPGGMSGGPFWTFKQSTDDEVWSPAKKAVLVGINFWWDNPHCIRAVPISEWLNLVQAANPEWKSYVEAARMQR